MFFSLELRGSQALELAPMLAKHPDRLFEWEVLGSMVQVFFPLYERERARVVVLFWPDPRSSLRRVGRTVPVELVSYRSSALNSMFCQALRAAFQPVLAGRRPPHPGLEQPTDLEILLSPVCTYLHPERVQGLFEPLGYQVELQPVPGSIHLSSLRHPTVQEIRLRAQLPIPDVLRHLLVLLMVLDSDRHEYMGQGDLERLRRLGSPWLDSHPDRSYIVSRYLIYRRLVDGFLQNSLTSPLEDDDSRLGEDGYDAGGEPQPVRQSPDAHRNQELADVLAVIPGLPRRLLAVTCGDGRLLGELVGRGLFEEIMLMDPSQNTIERTRKRLERSVRFTQGLRHQPLRLEGVVSALGYHDPRLHGYEGVLFNRGLELHDEAERFSLLVPVLEHWSPQMLICVASNLRGLTTQEEEPRGPRGGMRLDELVALCQRLCLGRPYEFRVLGVGPGKEAQGAPMLVAVLERIGGG